MTQVKPEAVLTQSQRCMQGGGWGHPSAFSALPNICGFTVYGLCIRGQPYISLSWRSLGFHGGILVEESQPKTLDTGVHPQHCTQGIKQKATQVRTQRVNVVSCSQHTFCRTPFAAHPCHTPFSRNLGKSKDFEAQLGRYRIARNYGKIENY